jgi:uncharacterized repeat protein (TIGR01451 family)
MARKLTILTLAMLISGLPATAWAQEPLPPFRVLSGFGNDGCAGNNPGFDVGDVNPVHDQRSVTCFSGFGEVEAAAGRGLLEIRGDVTHTGFGTATNMNSEGRLRMPFTLVSATDTMVQVTFNLQLHGTVVESPISAWGIQFDVAVDNTAVSSGSRSRFGTGGFAPPPLDGVVHPFTTQSIMLATNAPHILEIRFLETVGTSEARQALAARLAFASVGPFMNLPAGVTLADVPVFNLANNHWTDPRLPPSLDVVIDATTTQAFLDGLITIPASVIMDHAFGRGTLVMPNLQDVGCNLTVTSNPDLTELELPALDRVRCGIAVEHNPALNIVDIPVATSVEGDVRVVDNDAANLVDISVGTSVGGSVTVTDGTSNTILLDVGGGIGRDVTVRDNNGTGTIDLSVGAGIGGSITIDNNSGAEAIDLSVGSGIGGSVTIHTNGDAAVTVDTPGIGGDETIAGGRRPVRSRTADGTTRITLAEAPATMTVVLPDGSFTEPVAFSIQSMGALGPSEGTDAGGQPVIVTPVAGWAFAFDIPTLNRDASLTFDIDVAALGSGAAAFLDALASNAVTLAVRGDAAGSVFQTFAVCAGPIPSAGCASVTRLDASGQPIAPANPAIPVTVRFAGVTGHFSTFGVVIVTHPDTTAPVISNMPADISVEATGPAGAAVTYALPSAQDDRDGAVGVTCAPPSGSVFAIGTTTVTCTAADAAGNASTAAFHVTVTAAPASANHAPVNSVPGPQGTAVNLPLLIARFTGNPIAVADEDPSTGSLRVTLTAVNGTLTLCGRSGLTFVAGNGVGNPAMTFTGSMAAINAALDGLIFAPRFGFSGVASLTLRTEDPAGATDTDVVPITVGARADLAIALSDAPDPITVGARLTYTAQVSNGGPFGATAVTVLDVLPPGVTFVSSSASQGACSYGGLLRTVRCDLGALAAASTATVTIVVTPTQRTTLSNGVAVGANQFDPAITNNVASARTLVR